MCISFLLDAQNVAKLLQGDALALPSSLYRSCSVSLPPERLKLGMT